MTSKVSYTSASIAPASQNGTTGLWAICWLWFRLEEPKQKKTVHKNIKNCQMFVREEDHVMFGGYEGKNRQLQEQ